MTACYVLRPGPRWEAGYTSSPGRKGRIGQQYRENTENLTTKKSKLKEKVLTFEVLCSTARQLPRFKISGRERGSTWSPPPAGRAGGPLIHRIPSVSRF